MASRNTRYLISVLILAFGAAVVGVSVFLVGQIGNNPEAFSRLHAQMLTVNFFGGIALFVLITAFVIVLVRDYRQKKPGARLKTRMLLMFSGLAILPLIFVYYTSVQFLQSGIDSYFNVEVEQGLNDALDLSRKSLDVQRELVFRRVLVLTETTRFSRQSLVRNLGNLQRQLGAQELSVFTINGDIVATHSETLADNIPRLEEETLLAARRGPLASLSTINDNQFVITVTAPIDLIDVRSTSYLLHVVFPLNESIRTLAESVQKTHDEYKQLTYLRDPLQLSFVLALGFVLLLAMLASLLGAFISSDRIVAPIQALVAGTKKIGQGAFDTRLKVSTNDEIGDLTKAFNSMASNLAGAHDVARKAEQVVTNERTDFATVLGQLSSGVIALEHPSQLRMVNRAARDILELGERKVLGQDLRDLAKQDNALGHFAKACLVLLDRRAEWREKIEIDLVDGRRTLICACTPLTGSKQDNAGQVIVFEDISDLLTAQRDAAWGEVARRLAHEIKNPLTPIQLAAERLKLRLSGELDSESAKILGRGIHTITQQVESMKTMVNAFSDYARAPEAQFEHYDLNQLIIEIVDMYRAQNTSLRIDLTLNPELKPIEIDQGKMRQVLHNLIQNSLEAMVDNAIPRLSIKTQLVARNDKQFARVVMEDNGPGFGLECDQAFDPYVTTKQRGSGLGLAIVKRLIEEHKGRVQAANQDAGGARITIMLPLSQPPRSRANLRLVHSV